MMSEILQDHGLGKGLNGADKKALIDIVNAADINASDVKTAVAIAIKAKDDRLKLTPESSWGEIQLALADFGIDYNKVATGTFTTAASPGTYPVPNVPFNPLIFICSLNDSNYLIWSKNGTLPNICRSSGAVSTIQGLTYSNGTLTISTSGTVWSSGLNMKWFALGLGDLPDLPDIYNKVASGKTNAVMSALPFAKSDDTTKNSYYIKVEGLEFKPERIVVTQPSFDPFFFLVYDASLADGAQIKLSYGGINTPVNFKTTGNAYVADTGFQLPIWDESNANSGAYEWFAYGKGETPNLFNKVKKGRATGANGSITVTGLGFRPISILAKDVTQGTSASLYFMAYSAKTGFSTTAATDLAARVGTGPLGLIETITDDGFTIGIGGSNGDVFEWIAYGEGELPDPPPDSYNRVASGTISANIPAGGTATVSGIGFVPKYIMLHAQGDDVVSVSGDYPQAGTAAGGWRSSSSISNGPRVMTKPTDDSFVITNSNGSIALTAPIVWTAYGVGANPDPVGYKMFKSGAVTTDLNGVGVVTGLGFNPRAIIVRISEGTEVRQKTYHRDMIPSGGTQANVDSLHSVTLRSTGAGVASQPFTITSDGFSCNTGIGSKIMSYEAYE